jgi:hypothetical protein
MMARVSAQKRIKSLLVCPVCLSDRLDTISPRMSKCLSCGFIWIHEISDRDNLQLIVEHQTKWEQGRQPVLTVLPPKKKKRAKTKTPRLRKAR